MKNYKQLIKELPSKKVVFAFGRFQPPTTGHELLVKAVKKIAGSTADHVIFASKSEDKKSNPLPVGRKVYYLKRMFPGTNFQAANAEIRTFIEAAKFLNKKYKNIVMVAGSDRVPEYERILNTYNGKEFHFDTVEVVSAGERDPDSDSASGMSGTKMREAAKKGDFELFKKGVPHTLTDLDARRLMNDIRKGMGLDVIKEQVFLVKDTLRELYFQGEIFNVGDIVESAGQKYEIVKRGTNHLLVKNSAGALSSKWLKDVQLVEDVTQAYVPTEIKFGGYTTKNLHHSADAAAAFQDTIKRFGNTQHAAVMDALMATDTYMGLSDLHLKQGKPPTDAELETWKQAWNHAAEHLTKLGELDHHRDYLDNHKHEMELMLSKFKEEGKGEMNEDLSDKTLKTSDKIKVARIIADAFGVESAETSSSPEQLVNSGLRKIKSKPFTPDSLKIIGNMLQLAAEVGIKYDNNLVPSKLKEGTIQPNGTDKIDVTTTYSNFKKKLESVDVKNTESDKDAETKQVGISHTSKIGHSLSSPGESDTVRRMKIRHQLGENYEAAEGHKEKAKNAQAKGDQEAYHHHMSNHHEEMGKWHESKGRHNMADISFKKAEEHHEASIQTNKVQKEEKAGVQEESAGKHRIQVTISDPNHTAVSKRKEQVQKHIRVGGEHSKEEAIRKATAHYKKQGYKVHGAEHVGMVKEEVEQVDETSFNAIMAQIKKKQDQAKREKRIEAGKTQGNNAGAWGKLTPKALAKIERAKKLARNEEVDLSEEHLVHVDDGSKYGDKPHAKDVEHVMAGLKKHNGEHDGNSDKGAYFKFKSHSDAKNFADHVKRSPHKTVYADLHEEYLEEAMSPQQKSDFDRMMAGAMSRAAYNAKWKKPLKPDSKVIYGKNVKEEAEIEEATTPYYKKTSWIKKMSAVAKQERLAREKKEREAAAAKPVKEGSEIEEKEPENAYIQRGNVTEGLKPEHSLRPGWMLKQDPVLGAKVKAAIDKKKAENKLMQKYGGKKLGEENLAEDELETDDIKVTRSGRKVHAHRFKLGDDEKRDVDEGFDPMFQPNIEENDEDFDISDDEMEKMAGGINHEDDIMDLYDDDEFVMIDAETGEKIEEELQVEEQAIMEVLSRAERMRAKMRFARTKAKRERRMMVALHTRSNTTRLNSRARKLAIKLMKQRMAKKPLNQLSVGEKERIERTIQRRKKVVDRLALKLAPRIRKIENDRLSHKKVTK